jgi:hypothetical protein
MADQISIQPPVLDLSLYAGDGVAFRLICKDDEEPPAPIPITGTVQAQVRLDRSAEALAIVAFSSDLTDADQGIIVLSLTGEQTQTLVEDPSSKKGKFTGVWDVQWVATDSEPRTLCQGKVECMADVTR